jgi:hypothetical protein
LFLDLAGLIYKITALMSHANKLKNSQVYIAEMKRARTLRALESSQSNIPGLWETQPDFRPPFRNHFLINY